MRFGLLFKLVVSFTALLAFLIGLFIFSSSHVLARFVNHTFVTRLNGIALHIVIEENRRYKNDSIKVPRPWLNETYAKGYPDLWFRIQYDDADENYVFGERPNAPPSTIVDTTPSKTDDGWFDQHYPLTYEGEIVGNLEVAINTDNFQDEFLFAMLRNIYLGVLEVLLGAIFAVLISLWLISRLRDLERASHRICQGDYGVHIDVEGNDEIAQTAHAFNDMSQELQKTVFELEKARNQFMSIFDTAYDGILILDEDKKIINANQAILGIFDHKNIDDILYKDFSSLSHREGAEASRVFSPDMLEDLKLFNRKKPFTVYNEAGKATHIKISPAQFSFDGKNYISLMIQDVSQSYKNEQAVLESEIRFRTIINTSLDGMVILDDKANINLISPAAERILGINKEQAIGKNFIEKVLPKREELKFKNLLEFYKDMQEHSVFGSRNKITAKRADGFNFPAEVTLTPLRQSDEVFFVIFIRDITAQQHAEALLLEARNQAEQASQAKSRFLAMMSHEIRTPIVGVIGILDLLSDDHFLSQNQLRLVHQAQESSENLLGILNDILDWSRVEQGKLELNIENFSLKNMLLSINQLVSPLANAKNLNLSIVKDSAVPDYFIGDPSRLRQVLLNLLSNAVKFTKSGNVLLKVSAQNKNVPIGQTCFLTFMVKDEGIGISKDDQKLLFKEFSQLDPESRNRTGGTGLGLAISRHLIHLMEGNIEFESEINKGTTFFVHLPFEVAKENEKATDKDMKKLIPQHSYRILLVEDVKTNHYVIRKQLEEAGYHVSSAWDGRDAVNMCKKRQFDIILMDMAMPNMSGLEATQILRKDEISTVIIGLSAHAFDKDKRAALDAGMNEFLTKPVRKVELLRTLSEFWPENPVSSPVEEDDKEELPHISDSTYEAINVSTEEYEEDFSVTIEAEETEGIEEDVSLIDEAVFAQIKEDLGLESLTFILNDYCQDNTVFIENLKKFKAGEREDIETAIRSAHSLKGSGSSMGLGRLSKRAATIEMALREGNIQDFDENIDGLFKSWEETIAFLNAGKF